MPGNGVFFAGGHIGHAFGFETVGVFLLWLGRYAQVLRDYKFQRLESAGTSMPEIESKNFHDRLAGFSLKRKAAAKADPESQAKQQSKLLKKEHVASAQWLCAIDNTMDVQLDVSMNKVVPHHMEWHEDWDPNEAPEYPAHTLAFCMDWEQVQLCGFFALENFFGMSVVLFPPPCHRLNNDWNRACYKAGYGAMMHKKIIESNFHIGPWQGGAFWRETKDMILDMATTLSENNPMLLSMWPEICRRHGWTQAADTNAEARKRFLTRLPSQDWVAHVPPKVSTSRWLSLWTASAMRRDTKADIKFAVTALCCAQGFEPNWPELKQKAAGSLLPAQIVAAPAPGASSAASSSSALPPPAPGPAPVSVAAAKKEAIAARDKLKKKCQNTLHAVCVSMHDDDMNDLQDAYVSFGRLLHEEYKYIHAGVRGEKRELPDRRFGCRQVVRRAPEDDQSYVQFDGALEVRLHCPVPFHRPATSQRGEEVCGKRVGRQVLETRSMYA